MSRRGHYGFVRRSKENARRAKQEAKRQRKRDQEPGAGPEMGEPVETGGQPGVWEWYSPGRNRVTTAPEGSRPASDDPDDWILLTDVADKEAEESGDAPPA